ncbi:MAG: hypothetical protein IH608_09830, partial [Proteobacteria bacterium]|nr:hypothetical protein [Pseudomonadota bacterium]
PYPGTELFDVAVRYGLKVPGRTEEWSGFNYRNLSADRPWISPEMRRLIGMLDFCSFFVGNFYPFKKTRSAARLAVRLYAPLARWRVKRLADRFPVEIQLAKLLRLYAKQE